MVDGGETVGAKAFIGRIPSPGVAGPASGGLMPERFAAEWPGPSPTGSIVGPVPGSTAKAEGSRGWTNVGVKAVFAVDAGGVGGTFATAGTGGAAAAEE